MPPDEKSVIEKAKNGDQHAFRQIYDQTVVPLYRFLYKYSGNGQEVEEWVQRAFIKAFKNIDSFNGNCRFSTWLFSVALNEMRSDFRRSGIIKFSSYEENTSFEPEAIIDDLEWRDEMRSILQELDWTKRAVFVLYEVEGYSHAEISSILDISETRSRNLLCRAKRILRMKLLATEKI